MQTKNLLRALKLASPALHNRDFVPILTHFCFAKDRLFAYDDKSAVIVWEDTGLECAVPGKTLLSLLDGAGAEIDVTQKGSELIIKDRKTTLKIPTLGADAFTFDIPEAESQVDIPLTGTLCEAIDFAAACSNVQTIDLQYMGVTLTVVGERLTVYSTDNKTITRFTDRSAKYDVRQFAAVIPKDSAELFTKVRRDLDGVLIEHANLGIGSDYVFCQYPVDDSPVVVLCKTIPTQPAPFEKILGQHLARGGELTLPEDLEEEARRCVTVLGDDQDQICTVTAKGTEIVLEAKGSRGQVNASVRTKEATLKEATIRINPNLLLRACRMPWSGKKIRVTDNEIFMSSHAGELYIDHVIAPIA